MKKSKKATAVKQKTYSEKLKDPRWQKKRLEILERDDWRCQACGDKKSTLNVHHTTYFPGCNPWGYPDVLLITLCDTCHSYEHNTALTRIPASFLEAVESLQQRGFLMGDIERLLWEVDVKITNRKSLFATIEKIQPTKKVNDAKTE